jgi:hypothetical protein
MDATTVAFVSAIIAAIIAVSVPWFTFRLALRQDQQRWLREQRTDLYVDVLTEAYAEEFYLEYTMTDPETQQRTQPLFSRNDVRLPPLERARLGSRAEMLGSPTVNRLFNEIGSVSMRLKLMRGVEDEGKAMIARVEMGRIRDQLREAVRHELGADRIVIAPDSRAVEPQNPPNERPA